MAITSRGESWTKWLWVGTAALLAVPFFAMRFTSEVNWGLGDFIFAALMFAALCGLVELAVRRSTKAVYRWAIALAGLGAFAVVWVNLAVGIVASEDNPYNVVFMAIVVATVVASALVRLRPRAMARILPVAAVALLLALGIGQMLGSDERHDTRLAEWTGVTLFAGMFGASALLFRDSAE